jgi:DNA modification methylase
MQIKRIPVSQINPAPYNPRRDLQPGDPEYERLVRSIEEFGCVEPLVWNKQTGNLVGGHQRLKVLVGRGETHVEVSVVDLPPVREKALNLALNKISGDWDQEKLAALLDELLKTPEFDLTLSGFEVPEATSLIAEVLAAANQGKAEDFDVAAELERQLASKSPPLTKPGDLILLGRDPLTQHRLLCGDSTDRDQVAGLMDGQRAVLMATDPPYLVDYTGKNHPAKTAAQKMTKNKDWSSTYGLDWDDSKANPQLYEKFIETAVAEALVPSAAWYVWHASRRQAMLEGAIVKAGGFVHCQIIWKKNRPVLTRSWYGWQHEPCLMGWLKGKKPAKREAAVPSTVWEVDTLPNTPDRPDHPTPKPLELFDIPLRQHTRAGEVSYEPFAGSGTQIIAAQRLGRRCFALEISPVYCDLIVRRFIAYAGESAVEPKVAKRYRRQEGAAA